MRNHYKVAGIMLTFLGCLLLVGCSPPTGTLDGVITSITFSSDGKWLAAGGSSASHTLAGIHVWNLVGPKTTSTALGSASSIEAVTIDPGSHMLASGGQDGTVRLWDLQNLTTPSTILGHYSTWMKSVAFSPDSKLLAASSYDAAYVDNVIRVWNVQQTAPIPLTLIGHTATAQSLTFSPDGRTLASGSVDGTVRLWDIQQPKANPTVLVVGNGVVGIAFTSDGQELVIGQDHKVQLRSGNSFDKLLTERTLTGCGLTSLAVSLDNQILAVSCLEGTVQLLSLPRLDTLLTVLKIDEATSVTSVAFSPDGKIVAGGTLFGKVYLWNARLPQAPPTVLTVP